MTAGVPVVPMGDMSAVVEFHGGPRTASRPGFRPSAVAAYAPPKNTMDPRYSACTDHHVACDCREAEFAEYRAEVTSEHKLLLAAVDRILAGHPTRTWDDELQPCQCTGCQIAREAGIWPNTAQMKADQVVAAEVVNESAAF